MKAVSGKVRKYRDKIKIANNLVDLDLAKEGKTKSKVFFNYINKIRRGMR